MSKLSDSNYLKANVSSSDDLEDLNANDCDKLLNYKIVNDTDEKLIKQIGIRKVSLKINEDDLSQT